MDLSRTYVEHALNSLPNEREARWQAALDTAEKFGEREPANPRLILLRVQTGLVHLARGELARQEAELVAGAAQRIEEAQRELRAAVRDLDAATAEIAVQLRKQNLTPGGVAGMLSAAELSTLQRNVNYQLARAYRNQGQTYAAGSADRLSALQQAATLLSPLTASEPADSLVWQSRLDDIVCHRLMQDDDGTMRRLASLAKQQPPPRIALAAQAEQVRLKLDRKKLNEALSLADAGRAMDGQTSSDLDYAILETYVAAWRAASETNKKDDATRWQAKASDMVREIDRLYGPYWSRRAEMLLAGSVAASPETNDVALIIQAAEGFYRTENYAEALKAYDRAYQQARASKLDQQAFDAGFTAAAIEQKLARHAEAAARFSQVARDLNALPRAGEAHLLAAFNQGQMLADNTPAALDEYVRLLNEQLTLWPIDPNTNQARLWLGRLRERQRDWSSAITAYGGVAANDAQFPTTVEAIATCYLNLLNQLRAQSQPTAETAAVAATWFENVITRGSGELPERWSPLERLAALTAAKIWLEYTSGKADRAERILSAAIAGSADAAGDETFANWKQQAYGLLVFALATQSRRDEASRLIEQLSGRDAGQMLTLLEGFARIGQSAPPEARRELAELSLRTAGGQAEAGTGLSPEARRRLDLLVAQALDATGRADEALKKLELLAKAAPQDGAVQEEFARLLLVGGRDAASWNAALAKWREVEQRSRPGTDRWFRAKYYLALTHERLGNCQRAAEIITLTQVLHPEMGGPEMKAKFEELLKRCK